MTVVLTINVGGRPKRDIIEMMREFCGQAGFEFELTPEEVASDLRLLDTMMAEWPFNLMGYDPATYGSGLPEDPSGIQDQDVPAVFMSLALRRAPQLGKTMSAEAKGQMSKTLSSAQSRYAAVPTMPMARDTVRGQGAWRSQWGWPYINEA